MIPIWSAHVGMLNGRNRLLRGVSEEIERILTQPAPKGARTLEESGKKVSGLRARYASIKDTYATWPVSFGTFRKFSITAALPLITGVSSILIDVLTR
jgi:hypothetical protein